MLDFNTFAGRLEGVISRGTERLYARCPAHADRSPSLSGTTGEDGRILLFCHAGCETADILASLGLTWGDILSDRADPTTTAATSHRIKLPEPDPLEVERWVLRIAAADLKAGKSLCAEDRARVEVAKLRLAAARRRAA